VAKELTVLQMKSVSRNVRCPLVSVEELLLTSSKLAGSALAWVQLLLGKKMLLDMTVPSSYDDRLTRNNNWSNCSSLASICWSEALASCFLSLASLADVAASRSTLIPLATS
jgi:hypothetical protein